MNVVIFGKGFGKPRQLNLSGLSAWTAAVGFAAIVSVAGFAGGYWFSSYTGSGVSQTQVADLTQELYQQRENIDTIRQAIDGYPRPPARTAPANVVHTRPYGRVRR